MARLYLPQYAWAEEEDIELIDLPLSLGYYRRDGESVVELVNSNGRINLTCGNCLVLLDTEKREFILIISRNSWEGYGSRPYTNIYKYRAARVGRLYTINAETTQDIFEEIWSNVSETISKDTTHCFIVPSTEGSYIDEDMTNRELLERVRPPQGDMYGLPASMRFASHFALGILRYIPSVPYPTARMTALGYIRSLDNAAVSIRESFRQEIVRYRRIGWTDLDSFIQTANAIMILAFLPTLGYSVDGNAYSVDGIDLALGEWRGDIDLSGRSVSSVIMDDVHDTLEEWRGDMDLSEARAKEANKKEESAKNLFLSKHGKRKRSIG